MDAMNDSRRLLTCVAALAAAGLSMACGASAGADTTVVGVYANAAGHASIEFRAEGRAHFSLHGVGGQCSYNQQERTVHLTCDGETTQFKVEDDGALMGPPDSFLTRLTKKT
jgi:hypothetical protein